MNHLVSLNGQRFGRLAVVGLRQVGTRRLWACHCDCGGEVTVAGGRLRAGDVQSCGCLRRERAASLARQRRKHGEAQSGRQSAEYMAWAYMQKRCFNPKYDGYSNYGGRGITVAPEWLGEGGFQRFLAHVGRRPSAAHSLDRIDVDGNYAPGNVRWATASEQARNRRRKEAAA